MYKIYRTKEAEYDHVPMEWKPDNMYRFDRYLARGALLHPAVSLDDLIVNINAAGETIVQILETPGPQYAIVVQGGEYEYQV